MKRKRQRINISVDVQTRSRLEEIRRADGGTLAGLCARILRVCLRSDLGTLCDNLRTAVPGCNEEKDFDRYADWEKERGNRNEYARPCNHGERREI